MKIGTTLAVFDTNTLINFELKRLANETHNLISELLISHRAYVSVVSLAEYKVGPLGKPNDAVLESLFEE